MIKFLLAVADIIDPRGYRVEEYLTMDEAQLIFDSRVADWKTIHRLDVEESGLVRQNTRLRKEPV